MSFVELNTVDPMIAMQEERDYLLARVRALEQIIVDQSRFNFDLEYLRFCRYAMATVPEQINRGFDEKHNRFHHGNLQKRFMGWFACARAREVRR